jgi:hypothetical protein
MNCPSIESRKATLQDVNYSFVRMSGNQKTGYMPAGYSSYLTCWPGCVFGKHGACYAMGGHTKMHMWKVTVGLRGCTFQEYIDQISILPDNIVYRPMVGGDLPGLGGKIDLAQMQALIDANRNRRGNGSKHPIGYTHAPVFASQAPFAESNAAIIENANKQGFTVNLSGDTVAHADKLCDLGIGPVVCVLPKGVTRKSYTPKGRAIVVCPAILSHGKVTCLDCQMCAKGDRPYIIGFPAHGMRERIADKIAKGELT